MELQLIPYFTYNELPNNLKEYFDNGCEGLTEENGNILFYALWNDKDYDDDIVQVWLVKQFGESIKQHDKFLFDIL